MCSICGSTSVPMGRDGSGGWPGSMVPARRARYLISYRSSRSHTVAHLPALMPRIVSSFARVTHAYAWVKVHGVNAGGLGSLGFMSSRALGRRRRSLAALAAVTAAALIFAVLLVLVRLQWAPLESADHGAAAGINGLIAGDAMLVAVVKAVTWLGSEGLEPEARGDLKPAQPEPATGGPRIRDRGRVAAGLVVAWVLIVGIVIGLGELITKAGNGNVLGDHTIPHWFAAHRTPGGDRWSLVFSTLGATQAILIVSLATCVVFLAVTRRWRPVVFVATVMAGELGAFLVAAAVVHRPRPDVTQLDRHLPTSAYPSGHEAATCCLYIAIAILVIGHARGWWRWLFLIPAVAMPVLVALSRMYRGEHHPTDIVGSLLFAALWLTATSMLIKPNADRPARAASSTGIIPNGPAVTHRPPALASAEPSARAGRPGPRR